MPLTLMTLRLPTMNLRCFTFRLLVPALVAFSFLSLTACSPTLSPLYRDYQVTAERPDTASIKKALRKAGWQLSTNSSLTGIHTQPRTFSNWLLYKVEVTLGVVPVNERYIRLFIHPRRQYIFGGRTKLMFLKERLRQELLPPLNESFSEQGLKLLDPFRQDSGLEQ